MAFFPRYRRSCAWNPYGRVSHLSTDKGDYRIWTDAHRLTAYREKENLTMKNLSTCLALCGNGENGIRTHTPLWSNQLAPGPLIWLGYLSSFWRLFQQLTAIIALPLACFNQILFLGIFLFIRNIQHHPGNSYLGCLDRSISNSSP